MNLPNAIAVDIAPVLAFLVATSVGLVLSAATFFFARKGGMATYQTRLIETLTKNADALSERVELLEREVLALQRVKRELENEVDRLKTAVTDLAKENSTLKYGRRAGDARAGSKAP